MSEKVRLDNFHYHVPRFVGKIRDENNSVKELVPSDRLNLFIEVSGNSEQIHDFQEKVMGLVENLEQIKSTWGLDEYAKSRRKANGQRDDDTDSS